MQLNLVMMRLVPGKFLYSNIKRLVGKLRRRLASKGAAVVDFWRVSGEGTGKVETRPFCGLRCGIMGWDMEALSRLVSLGLCASRLLMRLGVGPALGPNERDEAHPDDFFPLKLRGTSARETDETLTV